MERKIPASGELEVYVSDSGLVCIREGGVFSDEAVVGIHPKHVTTVIQWLHECLAEAERMQDDGVIGGVTANGEEDSTHGH